MEAFYALAMCYATGSGVKKSAETGHLETQKSLVNYYTVGTCVEVNPAAAARYSSLATEQGDGDMVMDIVDRFLAGNGVKRDVDKASHYMYYKLAQEMGHSNAGDKLRSKGAWSRSTPRCSHRGTRIKSDGGR